MTCDAAAPNETAVGRDITIIPVHVQHIRATSIDIHELDHRLASTSDQIAGQKRGIASVLHVYIVGYVAIWSVITGLTMVTLCFQGQESGSRFPCASGPPPLTIADYVSTTPDLVFEERRYFADVTHRRIQRGLRNALLNPTLLVE